MSATSRLAELGLSIPAVAKPVASYLPATIAGNLVFTAGQLPFVVEIFGDAGRHARSAVGVAVLPLDAPVELELIVEFD